MGLLFNSGNKDDFKEADALYYGDQGNGQQTQQSAQPQKTYDWYDPNAAYGRVSNGNGGYTNEFTWSRSARDLQGMLNKEFNAGLDVDGYYGAKTAEAVQKYLGGGGGVQFGSGTQAANPFADNAIENGASNQSNTSGATRFDQPVYTGAGDTEMGRAYVGQGKKPAGQNGDRNTNKSSWLQTRLDKINQQSADNPWAFDATNNSSAPGETVTQFNLAGGPDKPLDNSMFGPDPGQVANNDRATAEKEYMSLFGFGAPAEMTTEQINNAIRQAQIDHQNDLGKRRQQKEEELLKRMNEAQGDSQLPSSDTDAYGRPADWRKYMVEQDRYNQLGRPGGTYNGRPDSSEAATRAGTPLTTQNYGSYYDGRSGNTVYSNYDEPVGPPAPVATQNYGYYYDGRSRNITPEWQKERRAAEWKEREATSERRKQEWAQTHTINPGESTEAAFSRWLREDMGQFGTPHSAAYFAGMDGNYSPELRDQYVSWINYNLGNATAGYEQPQIPWSPSMASPSSIEYSDAFVKQQNDMDAYSPNASYNSGNRSLPDEFMSSHTFEPGETNEHVFNRWIQEDVRRYNGNLEQAYLETARSNDPMAEQYRVWLGTRMYQAGMRG